MDVKKATELADRFESKAIGLVEDYDWHGAGLNVANAVSIASYAVLSMFYRGIAERSSAGDGPAENRKAERRMPYLGPWPTLPEKRGGGERRKSTTGSASDRYPRVIAPRVRAAMDRRGVAQIDLGEHERRRDGRRRMHDPERIERITQNQYKPTR